MKKHFKSAINLLTIPTLILGIGVGTAYAGGKGGEKEHRAPNFERIAEKLELSEAQTTSFVEIMEAQHEKRNALREATKAEYKVQMDAHKTETLASLSSILDSEQLTQMEEMMEKRSKKRKYSQKLDKTSPSS